MKKVIGTILVVFFFWGCGSGDQPKKASGDRPEALKPQMNQNRTESKKRASGQTETASSESAVSGGMEASRPAKFRGASQSMNKTIQKGEMVRPFKAQLLDGTDIDMEQLKGKFVFLDFWASWCGPCRSEIPYVKKLFEQHGSNEKFALVGISLDRSEAPMKNYLTQNGMKWSNIYDGPGGKVAALYGVTSIPFTVLINPEGKVIATRLRGPAMLKEIEGQLNGS